MNLSGEVDDPKTLPTLYHYQIVAHLTLIAIGCPPNLFIVYVIACYKQLHKPRSILVFGSCLANFFTLLTISCELVAHYTRSEMACVIFVAITGIAYTSLLGNMLLSLIDRYVSISYPLWYRSNITIHRVIIIQMGILSTASVMVKFPFLAGYDHLQCRVFEHFIQSKILMISNLVLMACCILSQIKVYSTVMAYLNDITSSTNCSDETDETPAMRLRVHVATTAISQLELDATWNLLAGVMSLLIFTFPVLLTGAANWTCRNIYHQTCSNLDAVVLFSREILLGHVVYNPIIYISRCNEFRSTVRQKFVRLPQRRPSV